jgi:glutamate-5-semialdehyde dehydrogenase
VNTPNPPSVAESVRRQAVIAKAASRQMALAPIDIRNKALQTMAEALVKSEADILFHNEIDVEAAKEAHLAESLIDRLTISTRGIQSMAKALSEIAQQEDPLQQILGEWERPGGIRIQKVRVPLGVVAMIYESRPNVTADAAGLCLKAGNAVILRGGSEAVNSNRAIAKALGAGIREAGLPEGAVQLLQEVDRQSIQELIHLDALVDLVIARGSEEMIRSVMQNATVPVLGHGKGVCHVYVDEKADLGMAEKIALNAKVQRPGVCNAMESLLVHRGVAQAFLPKIGKAYQEANVEIRGDETVQKIIPLAHPATEADWGAEYLDLVVSVRVVDSLEQAIDHINRYGSGHSDSIVTDDVSRAGTFMKAVDTAAVFHNASTRLHDGSVFGLGAEIGISTRKFHARGTMGARELTTTKYLVHGSGQIRE